MYVPLAPLCPLSPFSPLSPCSPGDPSMPAGPILPGIPLLPALPGSPYTLLSKKMKTIARKKFFNKNGSNKTLFIFNYATLVHYKKLFPCIVKFLLYYHTVALAFLF